MLVALYLFPVLVNYLSTGSLGRTTVLVSNAPESFMDYADSLNMGTIYSFKEIADDEVDTKNEIEAHISKGEMVVTFNDTYEKDVEQYYDKLGKFFQEYEPDRVIKGKMYPSSNAEIKIYFKEDATFSTRSEQLKQDVIDKYVDAYPDLAGIDTSLIPKDNIDTNSFNPVNKILMNRVVANLRAARIIPQIMVLMIYYTVYSLALDIFAGDRERGFFTKLLMSPISPRTIIWGKLLTIEAMAIVSSVLMFFMMFLASWLNFSNDALSLLPFGMLMLPGQLLKIAAICISSAMVMIALCVWIIFDLQKPEDITVNLQLPLATILIELFIFMIRPGNPVGIEYVLPIHNGMAAIYSIMLSTDTVATTLVTVLLNVLYTVLMLSQVLKKEEF